MRMARRRGTDVGWPIVASLAAVLLSMRLVRLLGSSYGGSARAAAVSLELPRAPREQSPVQETVRAPGRLGRIALRWWAEALAAVVALSFAAYVWHIFTRFALPPSGDSGQWLAYARFYMGETVPAERAVSALPPVVPVSLALFATVLSSKVAAVAALATSAYVALCAVTFVVGRRLSGSGGGGLLAVLLVCVAQEELFHMFSFAAYPQIIAMSGMGLVLYAACDLVTGVERRSTWIAMSAGVALTLFSHTPSATVLVPPLGLVMLYALWSAPGRLVLVRSATIWVAPVVLAWLGFLALNYEIIFEYASVDAGYDLRGPAPLWWTVWRGESQRIVLSAGAVALFVLPFFSREARGLKARPSIALLLWSAALGAVVLFAILARANTDYPRFVAYFMLPLGAAAAALAQRILTSRALTLALAAPILILGGQTTTAFFDDAGRYYGTNATSGNLVASANWLNTYGADGGVIAGTRESKWLEGLTGRSALILNQRIWITRPWEIERAIDAEVVIRANAALESGRLLTTVNDGGQDYGSVHPLGVRVDLFHKGIYAEAFRLDDAATKLTIERDGAIETAALSSLSPRTATAPGALTTTLRDDRGDVQVMRVVSMSKDAPSRIQVEFFVGTRPGIRLRSVDVETFGKAEHTRLSEGFEQSRLDVSLFDGKRLPVDVATRWTDRAAGPRGGDPTLVWQALTMSFTVPDDERRVDTLRTLDAGGVLRGYGVRYIVDRDGDGASFPLLRADSMTPVYENDEYAIYAVD